MQGNPTEVEIAYIAGLLEGEGTFLRKGNCPIIQLGMTDEDVIEKAAKIINIGGRKIHTHDDKRPKYKIKYIICVAGLDAFKWMKLILPHMCSRRKEEIQNIIEYVLNNRPFIELGKDYCKRGHSIKFKWEYFQSADGARRCKKCMGVRVRYPIIIESSGKPFVNPFTNASL